MKKLNRHIMSKGNLYLAGIVFALLNLVDLSFFHGSVFIITGILLVNGLIAYGLLQLLYLLKADWKYVVRNLVDFLEALLPLQKQNETSDKKRILIFNWRD